MIARILVNLTATNSVTNRTKAIRAQFTGDGVPLGTDDTPLSYLPTLEPFTVPASTTPPPPFPVVEFETARLANDTTTMTAIQAAYAAQLANHGAANGDSTLDVRLAKSLTQWLKDVEQVEDTPGNHFSINYASVRLTRNDTPQGTTYTLSPAATFGR